MIMLSSYLSRQVSQTLCLFIIELTSSFYVALIDPYVGLRSPLTGLIKSMDSGIGYILLTRWQKAACVLFGCCINFVSLKQVC